MILHQISEYGEGNAQEPYPPSPRRSEYYACTCTTCVCTARTRFFGLLNARNGPLCALLISYKL